MAHTFPWGSGSQGSTPGWLASGWGPEAACSDWLHCGTPIRWSSWPTATANLKCSFSLRVFHFYVIIINTGCSRQPFFQLLVLHVPGTVLSTQPRLSRLILQQVSEMTQLWAQARLTQHKALQATRRETGSPCPPSPAFLAYPSGVQAGRLIWSVAKVLTWHHLIVTSITGFQTALSHDNLSNGTLPVHWTGPQRHQLRKVNWPEGTCKAKLQQGTKVSDGVLA